MCPSFVFNLLLPHIVKIKIYSNCEEQQNTCFILLTFVSFIEEKENICEPSCSFSCSEVFDGPIEIDEHVLDIGPVKYSEMDKPVVTQKSEFQISANF